MAPLRPHPPARPRSPDGHLSVLDGVRGLAILSVLVSHAGRFEPQGRPELALSMLAAFGWAGVDLFFVLSGFLITGILLTARGTEGYYRTFYVRRTLRIFPLYYAYCAVLFLVLPFVYGVRSPASAELGDAAPWFLTYTMNVRIARVGDWTAAVASTAMFWSLCVEEQFYLVWPWIVAHLTRARLALACGLVVVVALAFRVWMVRGGHLFAAYVLLPARMDGLALGALVALVVRRPGVLPRLARPAMGTLVAVGLALVLLVARTGYAGWDHPWIATVGMTGTVVASAALLVVVLARPAGWLAFALDVPWLRFFGFYAYGMYMLGSLAERLVNASGLRDVVPARALGSAVPALGWHLALALGTTTALALLSRDLLEEPALRLKRFFPYGGRPALAGDALDRPTVARPASLMPAEIGLPPD